MDGSPACGAPPGAFASASVRERVQGLLAAGYREVRIITDPGWLLLPGGLPKVELPAHLTRFRKGRCASWTPSCGEGDAGPRSARL